MIYKLPKKNDPLKELIEKDKKRLEGLPTENIEEQKKIVKQLTEESLPQLENDIVELILDIKKDILSCSPKEILDYFSWFYGITNVNEILEDIEGLNNIYLDYIHSLVTSLDYSNSVDNCSEECFENLKNNIKDLHRQVMLYLMITSVNSNKVPDELRFKQSITYLNIRGDSYTEHKIKMCKELFSKYDEILMKKYNITSEQLIMELINIANSSLFNTDIQMKYMQELKNAHQKIIEKAEEVIVDAKSEKECIAFWQKSDYAKETNENLQNIFNETGIAFNDSIFKIHETSLPQDILEQITMNIGENIIFKDGKINYFPMNNSLIQEKPLVKIDEAYYCYNSPLIHYNLHKILENILLKIIPQKKHQQHYYKKKGEYLEDKSLEFFQKILPNCEVYKNLEYDIYDEEQKSYKTVEVDGLIIFDNHIFIIEAKSSKFSLGAKKGNTDKIKKDTKKIIDEAYQQAIRARNYILSEDTTKFRKKGSTKTLLELNKNKINNIYMINTTLESLGHITTNLNSLKEFGFVYGEDWIWSVYLNDLRIISEIIESPSEFLLYLERRIRLNDYPQIKTMEEIDIFGYFLDDGLYFEDIDFPKQNYQMVTMGYSKEIDEYYLWKEGSLEEERTKPSFIRKSPIENIIKQIEEIRKDNFSVLSKFLLNYDGQHQTEIKNQVLSIKQKRREDFSIFSDIENIGATFIDKKSYTSYKAYHLSRLYAYEKKLNNWFVIIVEKNSLDFEFFKFENKYDKQLEEELEGLKEYRIKQSLNVKKKIGRNELCPCGSGKKYKKCCLNG